MEQEVAKKRRAEDKKVTSGKKKVKADENPEKPAKGKKTAKKEEI